MKQSVKNIIMGLLVWACIIWIISFDPSQIGKWFKIAACIFGATWFWWWICDFDSPFVENTNEKA